MLLVCTPNVPAVGVRTYDIDFHILSAIDFGRCVSESWILGLFVRLRDPFCRIGVSCGLH